MNKVSITNKCLETILKKGDLYDAIALRENVKPQSHWFLKANILFLSRILYGGVLIYEKVKNFSAPIKQVKLAQDKIRSILGVNVDIIRSKNPLQLNIKHYPIKPSLAILYENADAKMDEHIEALKKIATFCELHNIEKILVKMDDITDLFADFDFSEFKKEKMATILEDKVSSDPSYQLFSLNRSDLFKFIKKLEIARVDKKFVRELADKIENVTIKDAVHQFFINGDLEFLKSIINHQLTLTLNSDSSYRDKQFGRIFDSVSIKDEYIRVISRNSEGYNVNTVVTTLYEFLGVFNFEDLLCELSKQRDNNESLIISALYLYLHNSEKKTYNNSAKSISFYDRIFNDFKAKRRGKRSDIPGLYTKSDKRYQNFITKSLTALVLILLLIGSGFTGAILDIAQLFIRDFDAINNAYYIDAFPNAFLSPYKYSFNLEKELIENIGDTFDNIKTELVSKVIDSDTSYTGDNNKKDEKIIAKLYSLNEETELPTYFANAFAHDATYANGTMAFDLTKNIISFSQLQDVEQLFNVVVTVSKTEINEIVRSGYFTQTLYPLGDNYVLTSIRVIDKNDNSKYFVFNGTFTNSDVELLESMKSPEIHYIYGKGQQHANPFVQQFDRSETYGNLSIEEARQIIINALNLDSDADNMDIFRAIKHKKYSETPIKDAGLTRQIKNMNEKEYLECIASLDSLICNMAATIAVETHRYLVYTVGYLNTNDNYITQDESHAWATYYSGVIVDITPTSSLEKDNSNAIRDFITFCFNNNIQLYALSSFGGLILFAIYNKKLKPVIKIAMVKNTLQNSKVDIAYAKIKEVLYGGINIPIKRTTSELIDAINNELSGLSADEIRDVKRLLLLSDLKNNKQVLREAIRLTNDIPYIRENKDAVKKALHK